MLQSGERLWVGVGSDHKDREVEAYGVAVSKQMCDKPMAPTFWPYEEVAPHWDQLILRSYIIKEGETILYQEGSVTGMLDPLELIGRFVGAECSLPEGTLMFCGTLPVRGDVTASECFHFEIEDLVLGRRIHHNYTALSLTIPV